MKRIELIIVTLSIAMLGGCGNSGGDSGDPNAPATISLSASKTVALADGSDAITVTANVRKSDGAAVVDGTLVTFTTPGSSAVLSTTQVLSSGGRATASVTHAVITGATNENVVVTAATGGLSNNTTVKFINQPSSVDVSLGFGIEVPNLSTLHLKLVSASTTSFTNTISAVNSAVGSSVIAQYTAPTGIISNGTNSIRLTNTGANGFNTGLLPIIKATYSIAAGAGLVSFSINTAPGNFYAYDRNGSFTSTQVGPSNVVITPVYNTER